MRCGRPPLSSVRQPPSLRPPAPQVLYANAHPSMSHISPDFIPVFGDCIRMMREVLFAQAAQPFIIAGSGTLGWDQVRPLPPLPPSLGARARLILIRWRPGLRAQVAANLVEPGENVLVLNSGYFGDSFADW